MSSKSLDYLRSAYGVNTELTDILHLMSTNQAKSAKKGGLPMPPLTSSTASPNGRSIIATTRAPNDITSRRVTLRPIEDGWWLAEVPSLPGCLTQGESEQAALEDIKDAIELYIECLREDEELIPADFEPPSRVNEFTRCYIKPPEEVRSLS